MTDAPRNWAPLAAVIGALAFVYALASLSAWSLPGWPAISGGVIAFIVAAQPGGVWGRAFARFFGVLAVLIGLIHLGVLYGLSELLVRAGGS